METIFVMMVGLCGSGKSTAAFKIAGNSNAVLIQSDEYRERLFAGVQGDTVNGQLFTIIHNDIISNLREGRSVVFDATNITRKNRVALMDKLRKLEVHKVAFVMATEFETCVTRDAMRPAPVGRHIISRMRMKFEVPQFSEGYDEIFVESNYDAANYDMTELWDRMMEFRQDNPHHSGTLGEHTFKVVEGVADHERAEILKPAALFHDVGKLYTKTFKDARGNPSDIAHFYGHEYVSAYEALFYLHNAGVASDDIIWICGMIQNHMKPYSGTSEKAQNKLRNLLGEEMYADLMVLHEADKNGK